MINGDEFFAQIKGGAAPCLILASTSAARQAVLRQAGLDFAAIPSGVDEAALKQGFTGHAGGAGSGSGRGQGPRGGGARIPALWCWGPTSFWCAMGGVRQARGPCRGGGASARPLRAHAPACHRGLRGHGRGDRVVACRAGHVECARVERGFHRPLSGRRGQGVLGCVGAYRLEGLGAQLFTRIEGDYFTILGLSLLPLLGFLRGAGVLAA